MARKITQKQKKSRERIWGSVIAGVALILIAAVGFMYIRANQSRIEVGDDGCPASGAESVTVLLVDQTDPLSLPQRQDFRNQFEILWSGVPKHGRISIYRVAAANEQLLDPILDLCNPGDGSDLSEATANPGGAKRKWEAKFKAPVQGAFEALVEASGAETSPIFQSVQSVALTSLQTPAAREKPRRLIIISDLIQNTPGLSFYGGLPDPETVLQSQPFREAKTDLRGVEVELWMLSRASKAGLQERPLIDLWQKALLAQGATVTRVYTVSG